MFRSSSWLLLVVLLAGLFLARESRRAGFVAGIDRAFFDWLVTNAERSSSSRDAASPPGVTLIEIDDSIAQTPGRVPLAPLEYASFLQAVGKFDPAVVAIEPILTWPRLPAGTEDILFEQALALPKLLLAVELGSSENHALDAANLPALKNVSGNPAGLPDFPEIVTGPDPRLLSLATASGATNLPGLDGAPIRDLPLLFRSRGRVLPSFTLQTLMLWLRLAPSEVTVVLGGHVQLGDSLRLPLNAAGRALLDTRAFGTINRLSLDDLPLLVTGQASRETKAAAARMRHGIVVLGRTDQAARTLKLPVGRAISSAEVFAWAAASLQYAPATRRASAWWDAALIVCFAALGGRLLRIGRFSAVGVMIVTLAAYAIVALLIFESQRLWLPLALPLGLALLICVLLWMLPVHPAPGVPSNP